ncbi:hypothetical protein [Paraliomyxa miuraensis]|uniref:hypothetical protein n=1 Tax=Paraliomyxa miuraensis TaxID=376150 RepID=UPI002253FEAC|nr:hypothetical protein [Paraliomyxa miuraensis]MCX4241323.1 hypothetical protein [Paraliomyxa miuraensis]
MIRIDRGDEPEGLVLARDEHLARARLRGGPPVEFRGYEAARGTLAARQLYKCAYCELTTREEAAPVEHYRPKVEAKDVDWGGLTARKVPKTTDFEDDARFARGLPPVRDGFDRVRWTSRPGYWWLAWTWENLVFGCSGCNSGVKHSRFPQARTARVLEEHEVPPGGEDALLLDPADSTEDPIEHVQYRRVYNRWIPTPRDGSLRGAWTIALLRLDSSPALLTAYDRRIRRLESRAHAFDAACASGAAILLEAWKGLCAEVFAPNEELLGLTYDWLDARYPDHWRHEHDLMLDKPILRVGGVERGVASRSAVPPLDGLDGLPGTLCDHIRVARNYHVPAGKREQPSIEHKPLPELITEILGHRPGATDDELATLLNRKPATIRKHRR